MAVLFPGNFTGLEPSLPITRLKRIAGCRYCCAARIPARYPRIFSSPLAVSTENNSSFVPSVRSPNRRFPSLKTRSSGSRGRPLPSQLRRRARAMCCRRATGCPRETSMAQNGGRLPAGLHVHQVRPAVAEDEVRKLCTVTRPRAGIFGRASGHGGDPCLRAPLANR